AAAKEAAAALESVGEEWPALAERERHWAAADINARAIATLARAETRERDAEAAVADFRSLAESLGDLQIRSLRSPEPALTERIAGISAEFAAAKRKADELLPEVHALRAEAEDLKSRYLALLAAALPEAPAD